MRAGYRGRLLQALTLIALLVSLLLNLLLYREVRHWYRLFNVTRRNPLGLDDFDGVAAPTGRPLVLFYGDSRARAWPAPPLPGAAFANRGIDGHTTTQCLLRLPAHIAPLAPDVLVLQVGINDLVAIGMEPEDGATIARETGDNIAAIVATAREAGITVVLTTIFPPAEIPPEWRPFWSPEIDKAVASVNARLHTLQGEGVVLFDTVPVLAGADGHVLPRYAADELHLSPAGYEALNAALLPLLQNLLRP